MMSKLPMNWENKKTQAISQKLITGGYIGATKKRWFMGKWNNFGYPQEIGSNKSINRCENMGIHCERSIYE